MLIGVALGIPVPYAQELSHVRRAVGDPLADKIPPHVTLLPPTEIADADLPEIREHLTAAARSREPFPLHLRGTRTFRPVSPVVYVALTAGWDDCIALQAKVNSGVLETQLQFPYHPHVTIAHDVSDSALDEAQETMSDFQAEFIVSDFKLYEYTPDGVWQELQSFVLGRV